MRSKERAPLGFWKQRFPIGSVHSSAVTKNGDTKARCEAAAVAVGGKQEELAEHQRETAEWMLCAWNNWPDCSRPHGSSNGCRDAFIRPSDCDPFNGGPAARRSRRGWEGAGQGDAEGREGRGPQSIAWLRTWDAERLHGCGCCGLLAVMCGVGTRPLEVSEEWNRKKKLEKKKGI